MRYRTDANRHVRMKWCVGVLNVRSGSGSKVLSPSTSERGRTIEPASFLPISPVLLALSAELAVGGDVVAFECIVLHPASVPYRNSLCPQ